MFYYIVRLQLETGYTIVWIGTDYVEALDVRDAQPLHATITCYETDETGKVIDSMDVSQRF